MIYNNGDKKSAYSKVPLWQWIVLYVVIGGVIYGVIYYFFFAHAAGYNSNAPQTQQVQ